MEKITFKQLTPAEWNAFAKANKLPAKAKIVGYGSSKNGKDDHLAKLLAENVKYALAAVGVKARSERQ
ncbi:MAG: hypothetical protein LBC78_04020 [Oscillospiraceae bacterium]|jgi:hypothetical protein|nr:hypothetical protein [Oscillospiraceae bacterium]